MRIGQGYDVHALVPGRALIIGGVRIDHHSGLLGHSDADVLLLQEAMRRAAEGGYRIGNIDATIVAQEPKLAGHLPAMAARIAQALACDAGQVNLKAKTNERLGYLGRSEGIEAQAVVLLLR